MTYSSSILHALKAHQLYATELSGAVAMSPAAGRGLKKLNARQSENFLVFLQNPLHNRLKTCYLH